MSIEMIWGAAGLLFILADVVFGTFFVIFLGAGALATAILLWSGISLSSTNQWLVFAAVSALGVVLLRKKLMLWFGPSSEERFEEHKGQTVLVTENVTPAKPGKVKYRGAEWQSATNNDDSFVEGENAIITHLDGIVVYIRKK
jgi:membrane protein implicated in regulation of membrane protease activity